MHEKIPFITKLILISIVLMLLILFLTISCAKETIEIKSYIIRVYTVDWARVNVIQSLAPNELAKALTEDTVIKENTQIYTYWAKEIESYTETSIRFIDNSGKEHFISADYIEVEQR